MVTISRELMKCVLCEGLSERVLQLRQVDKKVISRSSGERSHWHFWVGVCVCWGGVLTCTPGLTGVRGYICGKQTVWPYTGCWTTMEGLGWPWGRGGVGVLAGLGWCNIWIRFDIKEQAKMARYQVWRRSGTDLRVEPGFELISIGVEGWFPHLPAGRRGKRACTELGLVLLLAIQNDWIGACWGFFSMVTNIFSGHNDPVQAGAAFQAQNRC